MREAHAEAGEHEAWRDRCPLCARAGPRELRKYAHAHLVRCGGCGLVFCRRVPTTEELIRHYRQYGYGSRSDTQPSWVTAKRYSELLDQFDRLRDLNHLLDIGCGEGLFLNAAKERGWETYGTELSEDARKACATRGIEAMPPPLTRETFRGRFFDVVTAHEVIEHLTDPFAELRTIRSLLRPGGVLYVTTPNFNSLSRRLLNGAWNVVEYPEHLFYFTARTMDAAAARWGFEAEGLTTTGISITRAAASVGKDVSAAAGGSADERLRTSLERRATLRVAKRAINGGLSALRAGDTLKVTLRAV